MKKIGGVFGPGRLIAVAALLGIAVMTVLAVPLVASADEDGIAPKRGPGDVQACRDRVGADHPRLDAFLNGLVQDEVITAEQAAEIDSRLDDRHFDACVARILRDRGNAIEATATVTNAKRREVIGALVAGESLSRYANERGGDDATLIAAIMEDPTVKATELVANGPITQEEVDNLLAQIEGRASELINLTDIKRPPFGGDYNPPLGAGGL
ncbi:hypothetical protein BH23CHL2_BH23CHL2_09670 [soil metagenome]